MVEAWADREFAGARLPHPANVKSVARICERLAEQPGSAYSRAVGSSGRQAGCRIFGNPQVTPDDLLYGHFRETGQRCVEHSLVIVAQDTTDCDYSRHRATTGLGPVNDSATSRGFFMHSSLAVTAEETPLGLLSVQTWVRDADEYGKRATRRERDIEDKESRKWLAGLAGIQEALPEGQRALVVSDRESDVYGYFTAPRRESIDLLVRACWRRSVEVPVDREAVVWMRMEMFAAATAAPAVGEMEITVPRKPGQPERKAVLEVRAGDLRVLPPRHRRKDVPNEPVPLRVIRAAERDAPQGVEPVEWVLLTTLKVERAEDACQCVFYYTRRWMAERFHFTLKDGMKIERLQIDDEHALRNAVAVHGVAAWKVMSLTHLGRERPELPASLMLSPAELAVLSQYEGKPVVSLGDALAAVARLGGQERYQKAPPAGVKRVWMGLSRLEAMVAGWQLARKGLGQAGAECDSMFAIRQDDT